MLVEVGDGDPCGSKDTRVTGALENIEAPENGHAGLRASPLIVCGISNAAK